MSTQNTFNLRQRGIKNFSEFAKVLAFAFEDDTDVSFVEDLNAGEIDYNFSDTYTFTVEMLEYNEMAEEDYTDSACIILKVNNQNILYLYKNISLLSDYENFGLYAGKLIYCAYKINTLFDADAWLTSYIKTNIVHKKLIV